MKDVIEDIKNNILIHFPRYMNESISRTSEDKLINLNEIRIRINRPIIARSTKEYILDNNGFVESSSAPIIAEMTDLNTIFNSAVRHSPYAYNDEIKNGYVTLKGGHRVGICGRAVHNSNNQTISTIKNISSLNIRISKEILTAAKEIMAYITEEGKLLNTLIISAPSCGKTTVLRDIIRRLSDGIDCDVHNVAIADERGEVASCFNGVSQNDVGSRTDVLDAVIKAEGIMNLIRSMSPMVVATDEVGTYEDAKALKAASLCGVKILCTAHAYDIEDMLIDRDTIKKEICSLFDRIVVLQNLIKPGQIKAIYNASFERIF
jgi:stage III sporulation protein AA